MSKITIKTGGGHLLDIVHSAGEATSPYYILRSDVPLITKYMEDNNIQVISNDLAKILLEKGWLKKSNEAPF